MTVAGKNIYRVFRSIVFTLVLVVIGLITALYVTLSIPAVNDRIRIKAESELSSLLGGKVTISSVDIIPFNEVRLFGVSIFSPDGEKCISAGRIGTSVNLWDLVSDGRYIFSYVELISLDAKISQAEKDGPLNIDFLIKALSPKDKKKPPTKFDLTLKNIVIRKSNLSFDRNYIPLRNGGICRFDPNHIKLTNLRADIELPRITNDDFLVDIKRLALNERSGLKISSLSMLAHISTSELSVRDFSLKLPNSEISINDQLLKIDGFSSIEKSLQSFPLDLRLNINNFVPSDFSAFCSNLDKLDERSSLSASVSGKIEDMNIDEFRFANLHDGSKIDVRATLANITKPEKLSGEIKSLQIDLTHDFAAKLTSLFNIGDARLNSIIDNAGDILLSASSKFDIGGKKLTALVDLVSGLGDLQTSADFKWGDRYFALDNLFLIAENVDIQALTGNDRAGLLSADVKGNITVNHNDITGAVAGKIPYAEFNGTRLENINLTAEKSGKQIECDLEISDTKADLSALATVVLDGPNSHWNLQADIRKLMPGIAGIKGFGAEDNLTGKFDVALSGNTVDNILGEVSVSDLDISGRQQLKLNNLRVTAANSGDTRQYAVSSDILNGCIAGNFTPDRLIHLSRNMIAAAVPMLVKENAKSGNEDIRADYEFVIDADSQLLSELKLPVKPLSPVKIYGYMDGSSKTGNLIVDAPVLLQGKNKIINGTRLNFDLSESTGINGKIIGALPVKHGIADLDITLSALNDNANILLQWVMENNSDNTGRIGINASIDKDPLTGKIHAVADILESGFRLKESDWRVSPARIDYTDKNIAITGLHVANGQQYIDITGKASENPMDAIKAELVGIDLDYVFDILNINNVDFGGTATGKAMVSGLFSKAPIARTDGLFVKSLSYNNSVLGDGELESHWDNQEKMVAINADINSSDSSWATVRGGVYVTRDSLSFDFNTSKLDIGFLKPFMSGFTSDVKGRASGKIKLFGTFSDIDLAGRAHADTITMKVDHTNVFYSGSDSIFFTHGKIEIPPMRLYDKYGHSGVFRGIVTHNYLHDAKFDFNISDTSRLLIYDTGPKQNSKWYGHILASGSAALHGEPGMINLNITMSTDEGSEFTLALDETETASEYTFLSFGNKNKSEITVNEEDVFNTAVSQQPIITVSEQSDLFMLDMNLDITPGVKMTIIMDPKAGDKITAYGAGGMRMHYDTNSDELAIYGKYTLRHGIYNFSLQDLILKNFNIVEGSGISFNGDPMLGILDITAAYRVNTNLTDLDQSFSTDPDLNRTSIPVDALLKVKGDIHAPEIKFDLSLPTVTSDVERKVRSIVSTEDMMNKQIIYLLALNRFYTPEYTGAEQGGELSSVASSTISSQIQNIIGSLTDKFSLAPSFKSEKSDFSDMEVDVALSSRLFDNRLLINGNLGYRDKSTSQTTFIGDFDLEYFLSRDGRLRLKAYNHFNDASYYLKSALTTQGIGIKYHKDFDDPFTFVKRLLRKRRKTETKSD